MQKQLSGDEFAAMRKRMGKNGRALSYDKLGSIIGKTKATLVGYEKGHQPIPLTVKWAMVGYEKSLSLDKYENFVVSVDQLYREGKLSLDDLGKTAGKLLEQEDIE
jgi:hypothetical protein